MSVRVCGFSASDEADREPEGTFGALTVGRLLCPSMWSVLVAEVGIVATALVATDYAREDTGYDG